MPGQAQLEQDFFSTLSAYQVHPEAAEKAWDDICVHYSAPGRHYHTLSHLADVYEVLLGFKEKIHHWDAVFFALCYHDVIYDPARGDNETRSAHLAFEQLTALELPAEIISRCEAHILATRDHAWSADNDSNYFTDADLSILGSDTDHYLEYARNIRKEFSAYPEPLYAEGRKAVLRRFLARDTIFNMPELDRLEEQARQNMQQELKLLETNDKS